ncbi:MAG: ChaN family lipoprotein, partial [Deltaproteobacteria bacterium]|nr:ChaN family lipoprotein [Deltaproteobacteria bacterium]
MVLSPREELLSIQKSLYRRNQRLIDESIFVKEHDFLDYEKTYKRYVRDYQKVVSVEEMMKACDTADIIYVGDYHTCNQSQRSFLRILKAEIKKNKKFILGLELLHKRHQKFLNLFFKGRLSEETFLKKVGLKKHWVFDLWENFKPI